MITTAPDMLELIDDYDARASHFAADKGFVDILELLYAEVRTTPPKRRDYTPKYMCILKNMATEI